MAQYLISVHHSPGEPAPSEEQIPRMHAQVGAFNDEVMAAGAWVFAGGLHEPSAATVVDGRGGKAVLTDGPFSDSKEYLGGFWIIEVPDLDAALEWATKGSAACEAPVEVRPFQGE